MNRLLLTGLAVLACTGTLAAQDGSEAGRPVSVGLVGWGTMNIHRGDFSSYDGVLECGTFADAETLGWAGGYLVDIPLFSTLDFSGRLYYWNGDGTFTADNPVPARIAVDEQTIVPLETEHRLETALDYLMVDLLAKWRFGGPFYLAVGPSVGYAARASYEQEEEILSPTGVTFANGSSTRNIIAGNFDEQGTLNTNPLVRLAGTGMLGAEIALTDRLTLTPEAGLSYGFTSVLSSIDWKVQAVRVGAGLLYSLGGEQSAPDTIRIDPPDNPTPRPVIALDAFNRTNGMQLNYAEIAIREEGGLDRIPLLPYVFFGPNQSTLPARYHRQNAVSIDSFSESGLRDSTLGIYHDMLNILGSRMRRWPETRVTVTGCREPLHDTGSTDRLSIDRATAVREYLTSVWGIAPERISVESRTLPQAISNRSIEDGREENRRAELTANDPRLLAPVTRNLGSLELDPEEIVIEPTVQFGESVRSWRMAITSEGGKELWSADGTGAPTDRQVWRIPDQVIDDLGPSGSGSGQVRLTLEATTQAEGRERATRDIPVRRSYSSRRYSGEIVRDSLVERYSVIFFDFDRPVVNSFNQDAIEIVRNRMRTSSAVSITGLTDRIGDADYNANLSVQRAEQTAQLIQTRIVPEVMHTEGAGETFIYNNDLPEGRMYNRTVIVEIATPVEDM